MLPSPSPLRTVRESFPSQPLKPLKKFPCGDSRKPEMKVCFTLLSDCQNSQWHAERTIRRRHLLSLLSSDSPGVPVTKDLLNVCLLTKPGMLHPVSRSLQSGIRFFQHPNPARHQHALRLACPKGDGTDFPRSALFIRWVT